MHLLRALTGVLLFEAAGGLAAFFLEETELAGHLILVHTAAGLLCLPYFRLFFVHIGYERDSRKALRKLLGQLSLVLAFLSAGSGMPLIWKHSLGPALAAWLVYAHLATGGLLGLTLLLHLVRSLDRLRLPDRAAPTPEMPGGRVYAYLAPMLVLSIVTGIVAVLSR